MMYEELIKTTNETLNEYNKVFEDKVADNEELEVEDNTQDLIDEAKKLIEEFSSEEPVINFSQSSKEIDEVININIKKGEGEEMAVQKKLDNKEVVEEAVATPVNFEEGTEEVKEEVKTEEAPTAPEAEKVEEEAKKEDFEGGKGGIDSGKDVRDEEDHTKFEDEEDDNEDDNKEEECLKNEDEKKEECLKNEEEMSKADRKTYEARIATLENNLKAVKAELKVAAPFKALYEEAVAKIAELESYKEDVELDKLKTEKEKYASTCNFNALEDEDKTVVQEKIDDYKFSLYDFKAFMADVLKKYSRKQVYSNMEKIISYFSMSDDTQKADDIELPSDKNQAERILDKYSDALK